MTVVHLKKDVVNYKIPPMGPMISITHKGDLHKNAIKMLNFAIVRLTIFESSNDYISVLEYFDLQEYVYNGNISYEKDTYYHYDIMNIINDAEWRFEQLSKTHEFINDIPEEEIEMGDYQDINLPYNRNLIHLSYNKKRWFARESITDILHYLEYKTENNKQNNDYIKNYMKFIIDNEIFSKEDLMKYDLLKSFIEVN